MLSSVAAAPLTTLLVHSSRDIVHHPLVAPTAEPAVPQKPLEKLSQGRKAATQFALAAMSTAEYGCYLFLQNQFEIRHSIN